MLKRLMILKSRNNQKKLIFLLIEIKYIVKNDNKMDKIDKIAILNNFFEKRHAGEISRIDKKKYYDNIDDLYDVYIDHNYDKFLRSIVGAYKKNKIPLECVKNFLIEEGCMIIIMEYLIEYDVDISVFNLNEMQLKIYEMVKSALNIRKRKLGT